MSDEQWRRVTTAGQLGLPLSSPDRILLDRLIDHFQLSRSAWQGAARTSEIRAAMNSISTLAGRLKREIDSHPEIRKRLTGIVWIFTRHDTNARETVERHIAGVEQLGILARNCIVLGIGDREARSLGPNANVPEMIYISSLLNFWKNNLGRLVKNWVGTHRHKDPAGAVTHFVHACLDVAGISLTLGAVKQRIGRVRRVMDRNAAAGLEWNVLRVGSPEIISKQP